MTKRPRYRKPPTQLTYFTSSYAPGYRDLTLKLTDLQGNEYDLRLSPHQVQSLIYGIADVVRQIGEPHPPIDWSDYPSQICFPDVLPWMRGPPLADRDKDTSIARRDHGTLAAAPEACPGHIASDGDPRICGRCGTHIDELRPLDDEIEIQGRSAT